MDFQAEGKESVKERYLLEGGPLEEGLVGTWGHSTL